MYWKFTVIASLNDILAQIKHLSEACVLSNYKCYSISRNPEIRLFFSVPFIILLNKTMRKIFGEFYFYKKAWWVHHRCTKGKLIRNAFPKLWYRGLKPRWFMRQLSCWNAYCRLLSLFQDISACFPRGENVIPRKYM